MEIREGTCIVNNQGLNMTVIHRDGRYIDVQFDDGTIVKHKHVRGFRKHCICNPRYANSKTLSRNEFSIYYYLQDYGFKHYEQGELKEYGVGQYSVDLFNPELMIAIEYDGKFHRREADQKKNKVFTDNGITMLRVREPLADELDDGLSVNFYIANANNFDPALTKVISEVIDYLNDNYDVDIDTDIDTIRDRDKIMQQFLDETDYRLRNKYIGKRYKNRQGLWFEICDYRNKEDVDIKFDIDGAVARHKRMRNIRAGKAPHPIKWIARIGETNINTSGYEMQIIAYKNSLDIDVKFLDDGSVTEHRNYYDFKHGLIKHP